MSDSDKKLPLKTTPFLTKYEIARLIGIRMLHLSDLNLQTSSKETLMQQAAREILEGDSPAVIRRYLADGTYEDVRVRDLKIDSTSRQFQLQS